MSEYIYIDDNGHSITSTQFSDEVICMACGLKMWRKPQAFYVNWGGLKPSQGFIHPGINQGIEDARRWNDEHPPKE